MKYTLSQLLYKLRNLTTDYERIVRIMLYESKLRKVQNTVIVQEM